MGGAPATKAARLVAAHEAVEVAGPGRRFVSRGGEKLEAALAGFALDVQGLAALDVGSSTGGFTDCLLQHGARRVTALDVGRHQLHERLREDPRVAVHERTDIRSVDVATLGGPFPIVVADVSFISLHAVLDALLALAVPGGDLVLLVKPQFEAGRVEVSRGKGVIADPAVWRSVLLEVSSALAGRRAAIMGAMVSPLTGAEGNVEFLVHARAPGGGDGGAVPAGLDPDLLVAAALGGRADRRGRGPSGPPAEPPSAADDGESYLPRALSVEPLSVTAR
ncbi:hypothetical protein BH20ACT2_BH20ACT2_19840 [soil metagenome]